MRKRLLGTVSALILAASLISVSEIRPASAYYLDQPTGYLRVMTDPPLPSFVVLGSGYGNNWGLWVTANVGTIPLCFGAVPGYATPPCETATVTAGATTTVTGHFTPLASLHITTTPAVPSAITVDGVTRNNWGAWYDAAPGAHTVCWGPVAGYTPPNCQTINATAASVTNVTGTFTPNAGAPGAQNVGFLRVTTSPPAPVMITVNGEPRDMWGLNWLEMPAGPVRVCSEALGDYYVPYPDNCVYATVAVGETAAVTVTTHRSASIRITTQPPLPSTVSVNGRDIDDWGGWPNVPSGLQTICFTKVAGFSRPACQDVNLVDGQHIDVVGVFGPERTNISRFAGTGTAGDSGDGGPATNAQLTSPWGIARGPDGSTYISDPTAGRIRRVAPNGTVSTVAGCTCPYADNVVATQAPLLYPAGLAVDLSGNLFIADSGFKTVRRVDHATGVITTVAGNRQDWTNPVPENVPATSTALGIPVAVALDSNANLYILDDGMDRIRRVDTNGLISTFAGPGEGGTPIVDGVPATQAPIREPNSMVVSGANLYFADAALGRVRRVSLTTNIITTVAGSGVDVPFTADPHDGGLATNVNLYLVSGLAIDAAGNLYLGDVPRLLVRRVDAQTGVITSLFDGIDLMPQAVAGFSCGPGCALHTSMGISVTGNDLAVTFAGDHLVRRVAGAVPAGP